MNCLWFLFRFVTRYAEEPSIMRYIKIAALLPDKTVRDVALRCRWLTVSTFSFNSFLQSPFFVAANYDTYIYAKL